MKLKAFAIVAAFGALMLGSPAGMANDSSTAPGATSSTEVGYVTTQGRRGGGIRRGGGGGGFVAGPRRRNNTGRNVAIGLGAAVLGAAILSQGARAQGGNSCGRWNYQCNRGAGWACRNLDRYC